MKTAWHLTAAIGLGAASVIVKLSAATLYVAVDSANPTPPYTNWGTAARVIQEAVGATEPGDTVLVADGVYQTGGTGDGRVALTNAVLLLSVNGPGVTVIDGGKSVRCACLGTNAVISGFTLTNGAYEGVWCEASAVVTNCVIAGNLGRGAIGGTLYNCTLTGNSAGGALESKLHNCTVAGNLAQAGGGACDCTLYDCIVYFNDGGNCAPDCAFSYCCTTPLPPGAGNIDADPLFVNAAAGDFRLRAGSPCIDTGTNLLAVAGYAGGATDILGNARGVDGNGDGKGGWDIGAYEFGSFKPRRFAPLLLLSTNGFAFSLWGEPGKSVQVERSLDLRTWALWLTLTASSNAVPLVDLDASARPRQFYRAVVRQ